MKEPLSVTHPEIAAQWHPTMNGDLTPDDVVAGSHKKASWKCPEGPVPRNPGMWRRRGSHLFCPTIVAAFHFGCGPAYSLVLTLLQPMLDSDDNSGGGAH